MSSRRYSSCSYCGGAVEERHIRLEAWIGETLAIFEDVPAGVCDQCGEEYLSGDIQDRMFTLAKTATKKTLTVPVYAFTDPLTVAKAGAKQKARDREKDIEREQAEPDLHLASDEELSQLFETDIEDWDDADR